MAYKILLRGDTKANWESVNPILSAREMVIETDTNRTKIGIPTAVDDAAAALDPVVAVGGLYYTGTVFQVRLA